MKKAPLLFLFISFFISAKSQTLFTYGKNPVTATEFLKAYHKNQTDTDDNEKSLRDYLDLYILFKLKVRAARDARLDTLPNLQADLQNFRSQVEENYLKDDKTMNSLIDEAFNRSLKDIHVRDYYLEPFENRDSITYLNTVSLVQKELKSGDKPIASIISEARKNGLNLLENDLGFITVFTLPYDFENIVYQLKEGEVSSPNRTKKGWHILKKIKERPAVGKIKLGQILVAAPDGFIDAREKAKGKADSIYNLLKSGADFSTLAKELSDDRTSYMSGGEMPEFGIGKYSPAFEEKAFSLQNDNDISKPFETSFGFHIIKRISATPISNSKNDEAFLYFLKNEVTNDKRIELARSRFIASILPKIGLQKNRVEEADLWKVSDSSLLNNKNIRSGRVDEQTMLFTFNDKTSMKVDDWLLFIRNSGKIVPGRMHQSYTELWPEFSAFAAKENYRKRLLDFNPNFKAQIQEFEEGNMLFEIMERRVWGEATTDSVELVKYYKLHKDDYKWSASADAILFSCVNENVSNNLIQNLKMGKNWRELIIENNTLMQGDSARFELHEIQTVDRTNFTNGLITAPVVDKNDGTAVFAKIIKMYPANQPRSFEGARGLVISDYQNVLEKSWVEKIKKKYPVKISENVLQSLLK